MRGIIFTYHNKLKSFFINSDKRALKAYRNIVGLFTLKGVNIVIGFIFVPLTLNYLDPTRYGIWITMSAIFNWFSLFDIGMGNGLRNRLAEALAKNNIEKARVYISTTYASLVVIFLCLFLLFIIANIFIDWTIALNTPKQYREELSILAGFVFFFFCMRFVTQLITTIALSKQEPAFSQFLDVGGRIVSLIGIYLLTLYSKGSLLYLGITLTALPVLTILILSIIIFQNRYKDLKPSFCYVQFEELKHILNLGIKFFVIQIAAIIFYQTNTIIISQLFGPAEVTPYSIAFQYFSVATFAFMTILTPYWSAFTDAYTTGETDWIKKTMRNLKFIWIGLVVFVTVLYFLSDFLIYLWVGNKVTVQKDLYFVIAVYVLIYALNAIYSYFMNGVGKVMSQFYFSAGLVVIHIPLAIFFCKQFGIKGIMFSTILFGLFTVFIYNMQYKKILNGTATGIWNK
jgi:O-antigen/teichoic acid export membrane protein